LISFLPDAKKIYDNIDNKENVALPYKKIVAF